MTTSSSLCSVLHNSSGFFDSTASPLRPQVASARGPGGSRATEHKRARIDNGPVNTGHSRSAMGQVDAGNTDTPAVSIPAMTDRPPDCMQRQTKRVAAAPMIIRGAFCRKSKIPKLM